MHTRSHVSVNSLSRAELPHSESAPWRDHQDMTSGFGMVLGFAFREPASSSCEAALSAPAQFRQSVCLQMHLLNMVKPRPNHSLLMSFYQYFLRMLKWCEMCSSVCHSEDPTRLSLGCSSHTGGKPPRTADFLGTWGFLSLPWDGWQQLTTWSNLG